MVKVRITYTQQDREQIGDIIETFKQNNYDVKRVSKEYKSRGNKELNSIYIDIEGR